MNSTKSPYKRKGQENIRYYSSEQAQEKHEKRRQKSRKKKILEKSPRLLSSIKELLRNKEVEYSPEIIAHLSQEGKIKDAENRVCANTIYSGIYEGIGGLKIADMPHKMRYYKKQKNIHTLTKPVSEKIVIGQTLFFYESATFRRRLFLCKYLLTSKFGSLQKF